MIQAKPVVPDQYWILRQDDRKVGNITADAGGYAVNINGETVRVKNLTTLMQRVPINFQASVVPDSAKETHEVHGYPTTELPYNAVFDVQHQLPLWTQEPRSRSWLTAGWYRVQQHRDWKVVWCPKLILLQRYTYQGPFRSAEEARVS